MTKPTTPILASIAAAIMTTSGVAPTPKSIGTCGTELRLESNQGVIYGYLSGVAGDVELQIDEVGTERVEDLDKFPFDQDRLSQRQVRQLIRKRGFDQEITGHNPVSLYSVEKKDGTKRVYITDRCDGGKAYYQKIVDGVTTTYDELSDRELSDEQVAQLGLAE